VRSALREFQKRFAATPPGAVLDGRDIGTVICPDADVKIFVTATPEVRARRRALEFRRAGLVVNETDILADILRRDARDTGRAISPLRQAADAQLLDTTSLDVEAVLAAAVAIVERTRKVARAR
jgi:cytidylate kinase